MEKLLDGKVAVITGAGRGLGRSHSLTFSNAGANVVVNDLGVTYAGNRETSSLAHEVVDEIIQQGWQAVADTNDVADMQGAQSLLDTALDIYGRVDILINNAAIIRPNYFVETSEEDWDEVIRVNLKGTFCPAHVISKY